MPYYPHSTPVSTYLLQHGHICVFISSLSFPLKFFIAVLFPMPDTFTSLFWFSSSPLPSWCGTLSAIGSLLTFVLWEYLYCSICDGWIFTLSVSFSTLCVSAFFIYHIFVMIFSSAINFSVIVAISCPIFNVWSLSFLYCSPPVFSSVYNIISFFVLFCMYI